MWRSYENISGGTCMISAVSVKDRLKNLAKEDGRTMQDELVTYGLERAIYRLSISEYAERFTLKGGIFLYALFDGNFARATVDIDLLAQHISNDAEEMKKVFRWRHILIRIRIFCCLPNISIWKHLWCQKI